MQDDYCVKCPMLCLPEGDDNAIIYDEKTQMFYLLRRSSPVDLDDLVLSRITLVQ